MEMASSLKRGWEAAMRLIALVWCSAALGGCTADVAKALESESQWTVTAYDHGRVQSSRTVARDSAEGAELLRWAKANPDGWRLSLQDYVPDFLVSSPSFRLNLQTSQAVFGSGRLQYSKSIAAEDAQRLRNALAADSPPR
jgi:hypothetical protein